MSQQSIDDLTAQVATLETALTTSLDDIQSDLDALKAANPAVDTTALEASVSALSTAVQRAMVIDEENPPV
jgi:hypothetical protein